jgi:hypothetical protein
LYHIWWDDSSWRPSIIDWEGFVDNATTAPAAVALGPSVVLIFAVNIYGKNLGCTVWDAQAPYYYGHWSKPFKLESISSDIMFISRPSAASTRAGSVDVFCLGADHQIYHKFWNGHDWEPSKTGVHALGSNFVSAPRAIRSGPGKADLFCMGSDDEIYYLRWGKESEKEWRTIKIGGIRHITRFTKT